jgi:hypothetical protein
VQTVVSAYLDLLQDAIGENYKEMMVNHYPVNLGTCGGVVDDATNPITDVAFAFSRGVRLGITLQDGSTCSNVQPSNVTVDDGMPTAQSLQDLSLATNDGDVLKAVWNWSIFSEDKIAMGVHNPDLSLRALQGAIAAVSAGGVSVNSVNVNSVLPSFGTVNTITP